MTKKLTDEQLVELVLPGKPEKTLALLDSESPEERRLAATLLATVPLDAAGRGAAVPRLGALLFDPSPDVAAAVATTLRLWAHSDPDLAARLDAILTNLVGPPKSAIDELPAPARAAVNALQCISDYTPLVEVRRIVQQLEGKSFDSFEANQAVCRALREALKQKSLRVACGKCGAPAILRVRQAKRMVDGNFQFDHSVEVAGAGSVTSKRTFHGCSSTVPSLRLVKAPADLRTRPA